MVRASIVRTGLPKKSVGALSPDGRSVLTWFSKELVSKAAVPRMFWWFEANLFCGIQVMFLASRNDLDGEFGLSVFIPENPKVISYTR